ncbi:hypothetical protein [Clostridiisalibacter paucivorans]|uniref:hypothetical protein n=1 Tax=Clostridiisalibacter paucivorans TaxID=408753 RepID=UPI00047E7834|nr:hypothetical protein [Clostridiisalibacter paucivorans]
MEYIKGNMHIYSDFDIRVIAEEDGNIDLFIPIDYRTLNLEMDRLPNYIVSRFQFLKVRGIIIRFNISNGNNNCTIHILRNIDLQSAISNFEVDYFNRDIIIKLDSYAVYMAFKERG